MRIRSAVTGTSQIVSAGVSDPTEFLSGGKTRTFCPQMTYASPLAAVLEGAVARVRPKMMTATAIILTPVVIPAVYSVWREYQVRHAAQDLIDEGYEESGTGSNADGGVSFFGNRPTGGMRPRHE